MKIIEIKNLSFAYEKEFVLEDINIEIEKNDFLAIIGPNGGGKSTLLKLILGLLKPTKGYIKIEGKEPKKRLSKIGYVPQNTNINIDFPIKVIEVVLIGHIEEKKRRWWQFGYSKSEISCAMGALKEVNMEKFANKKIGSLSGGERQRVMIARALCANPSILILDEPTANIDVSGQRQIYDLLKKLNKNMTIIVVSHDISIILSYATKVAHINRVLNFHKITSKKRDFYSKDSHFCEVEMLEMLGECKK